MLICALYDQYFSCASKVVGDTMTVEQWQLQCQVQVRCSVIEAPRSKTGRLKKLTPVSSPSNENDRKNR